MLHLKAVLTAAEIVDVRARIAACAWVDGRATAGHLSAAVKRNRQVAEDDPGGQAAAALVLAALGRSGVFASSALPAEIAAPLFNRYAAGEGYGEHIDNAVRPRAGGRMRLDLSATLFLSPPGDYEGGELVVRQGGGEQAFKLPAGDMLLYPAGSLHRVEPVRSGEREACFFWVQSLVRDPGQRGLLFDLDARIIAMRADGVADAHVLGLTALYHSLLRLWVDS
jgi:PKHD-type hydroxylase